MTGLTLPGMIDEPGCRSGMRISASPVRGPEPIQRMSLAILISATAIVRSWPDYLDQRVTGALGREVVGRLGQRQVRCRSASRLITLRANVFGALMPVPTAVPPSGSRPTRGQRVVAAARRRLSTCAA